MSDLGISKKPPLVHAQIVHVHHFKARPSLEPHLCSMQTSCANNVSCGPDQDQDHLITTFLDIKTMIMIMIMIMFIVVVVVIIISTFTIIIISIEAHELDIRLPKNPQPPMHSARHDNP